MKTGALRRRRPRHSRILRRHKCFRLRVFSVKKVRMFDNCSIINYIILDNIFRDVFFFMQLTHNNVKF